MLIITLLGLIFLIIGVIVHCVNKKAFDKLVLVIIYLTIQPIINIYIAYDLTRIITDSSIGDFILLILFSLEFLVISLLLILKYNISPASLLEGVSQIDKRFIQIDKARRVLNWATYSYIINLIITVPLLILITLFAAFFSAMLSMFPGLIVLAALADVYLTIIVTWCMIAIFLVTYVFTINGTLRFVVKSEYSTGTKILYIILMLIPIANFITNIILSKKAKKILKAQGIQLKKFKMSVAAEI